MSPLERSLRQRFWRCTTALAAVAAVTGLAPFASFALAAAQPVHFAREVLPLFSEHCLPCHGPDEKARKGGLRLDQKESTFGAAKSGAIAVVPRHSDQSALIQRLETNDPDDVMPPPAFKKPLSPAQRALLKRWIDEGAPWGRHWAFERIERPAWPEADASTAITHPIDRWVRARLAREGLVPAPEAPRATLLRRVTLDLTGLPPTEAESANFRQDTTDGAYERAVDRLLASPRFGERMAWDWLEAARYADSNGYQGDAERTMWPWRDWVVEAFNRNLPFDDFTVWQLAGDLLPNPSFEQRLATGFCRNHMINGEGGRIPEENRIDYVLDMTETTGTVWLGLTLNCARCHDHKYDPVPQRDYYGMFAAFNQTPVTGGDGSPQAAPNLVVPSDAQVQERTRLQERSETVGRELAQIEDRKFARPSGASITNTAGFASWPKEVQDALLVAPAQRDSGKLEKLANHWKPSDAEYAQRLSDLRSLREAQAALGRAIPRVMIMADRPERRESFILTRGIYDKPAAKVEFGVPTAVAAFSAESPRNRLGLARWLVSREHPLTARVVVNRLWAQFFGAGLVKTPEDFGAQGDKPVHPELLDWLAAEFMESGWDVKHLCRLIVTSATYRQSSATSPSLVERDPANRWLARGPRFRMPSWMLRDQALAASGLLSARRGGPPVNPYQPAGVWEEATFGGKRYTQDHGESLYRRSLYTFWRRIVGPTVFFDTTPRQVCNVKPPRTNTPLHALTTLNDVTFLEASRALAEVTWQRATEPAERLDRMFRRVLSRPVQPAERIRLLESLAKYQAHFTAHPEAARELLAQGESPRDPAISEIEHAAYTVVASTVLNLDEALTKE